MPLRVMPSGSARDRQFSGRRQIEEEEPFLVQQITGSPVIRGRRHNPEEDRFLVEDIPGSPMMRGRIPRVIPSTRNSADETAGHLANTSTNVPGLNSTSDTVDGLNRMTPSVPLSQSHGYATSPTHPRPPDNDDAPPSYESSIPPTQIGWSPEITSPIPFPMPHFPGQDDGRPPNTFSYPPSDAYHPIGLSPLAKSYQSIESSKFKSPMGSTSPSPSPSPDRCGPAYSYQHRSVIPMSAMTTSPRPHYRMDNDNDRFAIKTESTRNKLPPKHGPLIVAIFFIVLIMVLSFGVRYITKTKFKS